MNGATPPRPAWVVVHEQESNPYSRVVCRVDFSRWLVEVQWKGQKNIVDLARLYQQWLDEQGQGRNAA